MAVKIIPREQRVAAFLSSAYTSASVCPLVDYHKEHSGIYPEDASDVLFPVSPDTGHPMGDTSRLLDIELTSGEREVILNRIPRSEGFFAPSELSDDDIFSMIPPRYMSRDDVDVQRFRNYIVNHVMAGMDADDQLRLANVLPTPTESTPTEPTPTEEPFSRRFQRREKIVKNVKNCKKMKKIVKILGYILEFLPLIISIFKRESKKDDDQKKKEVE